MWNLGVIASSRPAVSAPPPTIEDVYSPYGFGYNSYTLYVDFNNSSAYDLYFVPVSNSVNSSSYPDFANTISANSFQSFWLSFATYPILTYASMDFNIYRVDTNELVGTKTVYCDNGSNVIDQGFLDIVQYGPGPTDVFITLGVYNSYWTMGDWYLSYTINGSTVTGYVDPFLMNPMMGGGLNIGQLSPGTVISNVTITNQTTGYSAFNSISTYTVS